MNDLHYLGIRQLSELIRAKRLSPVELTEALLARTARLDNQINSYLTVVADQARAQAKAAESEIAKGNYRGPLHGIPFALKDLIATEGILTTGNSRTRQTHVSPKDATVVAKLKQAGAILHGKQTAHEFAHGGPSFDLPWPPARNPWNVEHFTGGSSSGSGAGVAAGFVPAALGTDTGGSIRSPASLCGIVGMKATYGRASKFGVIPHSFSLDHCGPMARSVEDCALILQAIAGQDARDPASADVEVPDFSADLERGVKGIRIGVLRHFWEQDNPVGAELAKATEDAIDTFRRLGAQVENVRVQPNQIYSDIKAIICEVEAFAVQRSQLRAQLNNFGRDYLSQVLLALVIQPADYVRAQRHRRLLAAQMKPLYEKFDVFLTPGSGPAPKIDVHGSKHALERWAQPSMTTIFNITGGPALMLCSGFSKSGLPLGLQIGGRPFDEKTVFRVGHAYQQHTDWHQRHPELAPGTLKAVSIEARKHEGPRPASSTLDAIKERAAAAGLALNQAQIEDVASAIPMINEMAGRIPDHEWTDEPAGIFTANAC